MVNQEGQWKAAEGPDPNQDNSLFGKLSRLVEMFMDLPAKVEKIRADPEKAESFAKYLEFMSAKNRGENPNIDEFQSMLKEKPTPTTPQPTGYREDPTPNATPPHVSGVSKSTQIGA